MKKLLLLIITTFALNLSAQDKISEVDIQNFLSENLESLNLLSNDIVDYIITDAYESNNGMLSHIYLTQSIDGIPIDLAIINLTIVNENKKVAYHGNRFIKDLNSKVVSTQYSIDSESALHSVQKELGYVTRQAFIVKEDRDGKMTYEKPAFADKDVHVSKKYYYNNKTQTIHPTWEVEISMASTPDYWVYKIDGNTGAVLDKANRTIYCAYGEGHHHDVNSVCKEEHSNQELVKPTLPTNVVGAYNVFPLPIEAPNFGEPELVTDPALLPVSPFGWHDTDNVEGPEYTITRGNGAWAFEDIPGDDSSNGEEPDGGAELNFDIAYDENTDVAGNVQNAIIHLFYVANMIHDITYLAGFDELTGNFQENNFGNGGVGGDQMLINVDYTSPNNAFYSGGGDGINGSMNLNIWTGSVATITEPNQLSGSLAIGAIGDGWGYANYDAFDVTAGVAIAFDGNAQNATECCDDIVNVSDVTGSIALIDRGGCEFGSKALKAQEAGAVGCIICNVPGINGGDGENTIGMAGGADGLSVTIPTFSLAASDCNRIRASINSGNPVTVQVKPPDSDLNSSYDTGIIAHEIMHGVTIRTAGGPNNTNSLTSEEQMGEGWSDFLTLALTVRDGDDGSEGRGIGTYVLSQTPEGKGIRRFKYSTDMNVNPQTYSDLTNSTGQHAIGELWVTMLWEMYWNFVGEYGYDSDWTNPESGNFKALKLVIEGVRFQPVMPGFVDGRDAIIGADQIFYNGENECLIWNAFAKRGLGINADQGNENDLTDGVVSFESTLKCNPRLDIKREVTSLVTAGNAIAVTSTVTNFTEAEQTNVIVKDVIDPNLSFVDGSSNFPATVDGNEITFDLGTMDAEAVAVLNYELSTPDNPSTTRYYDDLQDNSQFIVDFANGFNNWALNTDQALSGTRSVNIPDVTSASDIRMVYQDLQVPNDSPAFRFWHKYETNSGSNGGFVEISTDGTLWFPVADKIIRNGYNSIISYANLVIPNLQGYTGNNIEDWEDVYIDLSEYAGQTVSMRFRFATADPADIPGVEALRGWYVDDVEMMNLVSYITSACASSDQFTEVCTEDGLTIVDSDADVSTEDQELDNNLNMSMYPNPANDHVVIQLNSTENYSAELSIDNLDGKKVYSTLINIDNVTSITKINTSNFPKGMYMVKIQSGNAVKTKKLVIN